MSVRFVILELSESSGIGESTNNGSRDSSIESTIPQNKHRTLSWMAIDPVILMSEEAIVNTPIDDEARDSVTS